jgi:hypothetical protein
MDMHYVATFRLSGVTDTAQDLLEAFNPFAGAELQRRFRPGMAEHGWALDVAFSEDFGWWADTDLDVNGKPMKVALVTCSEGDVTPDGGAEDDRWTVMVGGSLGLFPSTKRARRPVLNKFACDVEIVAKGLGATDFSWGQNAPDRA